MSDSDHRLELARFKVYQEFAPRFYIAFNDKDELYRLFRKKIDELGIALNNIYFTDLYGEIVEINDADSLLKIVTDEQMANNHTVRISVCDDDDAGHSSLGREKRAHRHMRRVRQRGLATAYFAGDRTTIIQENAVLPDPISYGETFLDYTKNHRSSATTTVFIHLNLALSTWIISSNDIRFLRSELVMDGIDLAT